MQDLAATSLLTNALFNLSLSLWDALSPMDRAFAVGFVTFDDLNREILRDENLLYSFVRSFVYFKHVAVIKWSRNASNPKRKIPILQYMQFTCVQTM